MVWLFQMYTRQYENIIVAHEDKYHMYNSDAMFKTFCAFETAKIISSKAVGVISWVKHWNSLFSLFFFTRWRLSLLSQ